jgi:large subunit ribosomal protein L3
MLWVGNSVFNIFLLMIGQKWSIVMTNETAPVEATKAPALVKLEGRASYFGVKAGMTQVYASDGSLLAVTVIDLSENTVTQVKTKEKEGYAAVQVGVLEKKAKNMTKPAMGHFAKIGKNGFYYCKEIRLPEGVKMDALTAGSALDITMFKEGDLVDLTAVSKGKGFQGGMKRYHMAGNYKTHGASLSHRSLGSIGNRADPGKTFKNKKMPGQMGNKQTTVQSVAVVRVDVENGILLVHGSVPGPKSGVVMVRRAIKSK